MSTELAPQGAGRAGRSVERAQTVLLFVFAVIPLTFVENRVLGFQMSGWSWLLVLAGAGLLVLTEPLPQPAVRHALPYLLFLAYACTTLAWAPSFGEGFATLLQFIVPALIYLLAWRVPLDAGLYQRLQKVCLWALGIAAALAVAALGGLGGPLKLSPRPMAISLVVLFVAATIYSRSWRFTVLVGGISVAIAMATGSRMSSLVLLVMILVSPSLGLRWPGRAAIAITCVALVLVISQTEAFRQRFFFTEDATLTDVLTLSDNVNTAGRRELWPKLLEECAATSLTGFGIGASTPLSIELSGGVLDHPHNDYIRSYCDEGWIGTMLVWFFFLAAGLRSWAGLFRSQDRQLHGAAGQIVLALLIFAITDNPLSYTAHFMAPLAAVVAFSDRRLAEARRGPGSAVRRPTTGYGPRRSPTPGSAPR
jgi:O-antigen ligase